MCAHGDGNPPRAAAGKAFWLPCWGGVRLHDAPANGEQLFLVGPLLHALLELVDELVTPLADLVLDVEDALALPALLPLQVPDLAAGDHAAPR